MVLDTTSEINASRTKLLRLLEGASDIIFIRHYGNVGDELIHAGTRQVFAQIPYREVGILELAGLSGETALVSGSGAWCQVSQDLPRFLPMIEERFERVIVLPSSFDTSVECVRQQLGRTRALVFAREAESYRQISDLCDAEIAHDCAFFFDYSPYQQAGQGILTAFRTDDESALLELPTDNNDISVTCHSLDEWLWTVARHESVRTDRAHVMIAAALLGKSVEYLPSRYHKVPSIATSHLQGFPVYPIVTPLTPGTAPPAAVPVTSAAVPAQASSPPVAPHPRGPADVRAALLERAKANLSLLPPDFFQRHRQPQVTIVLLSHGAFDKTEKAVKSLRDHVLIPFRLLLIDNGSDSKTRGMLDGLRQTYPFVELTLLDENLGCAGGRAFALNQIASDYVMFMDNDIEAFPGTIEHLLYVLESNEQLVATTATAILPNGLVHVAGGDYTVQTGTDVLLYELLGAGRSFDDQAIGASGPCKWVFGGATLFKPTAFSKVRYDDRMRYYYEDLEWCYRWNKAHQPAFYRSLEALVLHHHESKAPNLDQPIDDQRREAMPFIETIASFYKMHGVVLQNMFDFMPELGVAINQLSVCGARLVLELMTDLGSAWVLEAWRSGRLEALFAGTSGTPRRDGRVELLERQLSEQTSWAQRAVEEVEERDRIIRELRDQLDGQTAWARSSVQAVAERDNIVRELQDSLESQTSLAQASAEAVTERDSMIRELQDSLESQTSLAQRRARDVEERDKLILAQDATLRSLEAQLAASRDEVARMRATRVWRLVTLYWRTRDLAARAVSEIGRVPGRTLRLAGRVGGRAARYLLTGVHEARVEREATLRRLENIESQLTTISRYLGVSGLPRSVTAAPEAPRQLALGATHFAPDLPLANPLPDASIEAILASPTPAAGRGYDVVCFSVIDWDFRFQRPQQLMAEFARNGHRVFYLKQSAFLSPGGPERFSVRPLGPNLFEVRLAAARRPKATIYRQAVDPDDPALREGLTVLRREHGIEAAVAFVEMPSWGTVALHARERWGWKVVYDCLDEWEDFPRISRAVVKGERALVERADLVVVTSDRLREKWSGRARELLLARNAAAYDFFRERCRPNGLLRGVPHPIVGYYGAIAAWFDAELVEYLARERPGWQFALVGRVTDLDVSGLRELPNVHLLGEQPYERMPAYLYHFDVCLIPFRINTTTVATDPVKLYEYLSAGKPVVATMMPELEPYAELIYRAETPEAFLAQVEAALAERDEALVERRIALAREHTWEERWGRIDAAIRATFKPASIVVVTFNNLVYTKLCLESVLANTEYPDYEVVVVDNGSTDGTPAYLRYLARRYPRVRVILNSENRGFAAANNQGLAAAEGDLLVLLNNDTLVPRGWLTRLARHLEDPEVGLVGPVTNWTGNEARIEVDYADYGGFERFARAHTRAHEGRRFEIRVLAMFCLGMRQEVYERLGPLDERFEVGMFEDDDYALRARQAGYRVVCAEDAFVHHFGEVSFNKLKPSGEYQQLFEVNRRRFEEKWGAPWEPHQARAWERQPAARPRPRARAHSRSASSCCSIGPRMSSARAPGRSTGQRGRTRGDDAAR